MPEPIQHSYSQTIFEQIDQSIQELNAALAVAAAAAAPNPQRSDTDVANNVQVLAQLTDKVNRLQGIRSQLMADCCGANCTAFLLP